MKTTLWAKTCKDNRMINDYAITILDYDTENLQEYITSICYKLDIETPVLLSKHFKYLERYNLVKFYKDDFVDYIDFDYFMIEKSVD